MTTKSYIVIKDKAQTLTNKTIDSDSNVIQNLELGNLKSGVAVTSWTATTTDTHIPTEKLVKDSLDDKQDELPAAFTYAIPPNAQLTKSNKDSSGVYLTYTWTLGTAVTGFPAKWVSTLNADYTTRTMQVYDSDKSTLLATYTFTRTLDANGDLVSEVISS